MRTPFVLCTAMFISSCAPGTYKGLKESNAGSFNFRSEKSAPETFKVAKSRAIACYSGDISVGGPVATATMKVEGEPNNFGEGTIVVALDGMLGRDIHLAIEISAIDNASSKVNTIYAVGPWKKRAAVVEQWVNQGSNACRSET